MIPDSAAIAPARTPAGLLLSAISAALLEVTALVRMHTEQRRERVYEPDVYSTRALFLGPEWPRS
jgi:hypothetical protein